LAHLLVLLGLAALAAEGASLAGLPLAWMIGPMLIASFFAICGWGVCIPRHTRISGQTIVATAVGLQLTAEGVLAVSGLVVEMLAIALGSAALAIGLAPLLIRLTRFDKATCFFACVPCGPIEMAQLAERGGGNGPLVGLVQSLRIALVVLIVPFALQLCGVPIRNVLAERNDLFAFDWITLLTLGLCVLAGPLALRVGMVSPFFLGPLAVASLVALGVDLPVAFPRALIFAGQFMLGLSLGLSFDRKLLRGAPRFVLASALATLVSISGCSLLAWAIAAVDGLPLATLVLAAAPGSVTEMSLTAQAMGLGVALVTTFHIVRLFIIMPLSPLALRFVKAPQA
jgi:membrane AbrB-like protein